MHNHISTEDLVLIRSYHVGLRSDYGNEEILQQLLKVVFEENIEVYNNIKTCSLCLKHAQNRANTLQRYKRKIYLSDE